MTFRTKLLLLSSITVAGAVALVTGAVSVAARQAFERTDGQRRQALLTQLQRELAARGAELASQVERAASGPGIERTISGNADFDQAQREAAALGLDFLDVVQKDLTIVSSAHWPARFGYKNDWPVEVQEWNSAATEALLTRVPLPEGGVTAALIAIRPLPGGRGYVAGGWRLTPEFLRRLGQSPDLHAILWLPPGDAVDSHDGVPDLTKVAGLVNAARDRDTPVTGTVQWNSTQASAESFLALRLERHGIVTGVLLAGTSLAGQFALEREILWIGVIVGLAGIFIGVLMGWWTTERVTRPVERLATAARSLAAGDWSARAEVISKDEIGELAIAFNRMTEQVLEQRDRAIQAERVAAWRELARRLAHELKNPLFPLQITIENLQKARRLPGAEFDEVFEESAQTLLEELKNLKTIVGRFSDFAKMPKPHFELVDINATITSVMSLYDGQFKANGRPAITPELDLTAGMPHIETDPEQMRRAIGNLVLNAIDAMPEGGTLRITTSMQAGWAHLAISDSGQGLTEEECARLFTPYYTTKQHGTGLGLAIVQSVISDHHGKISVESKPGCGTAFLIDLPVTQGDPA